MVSSMGTHDDPEPSAEGCPYLQAKRDADQALAARASLDDRAPRPADDDPGTGTVALARAPRPLRRGHPRRRRARALECLGADNTVRGTFELLEGDDPVREAVAAL